MATHPRQPTGLARRERRLTDEMTERRMLDAAVAMVSRTGLTVSLEHISFEDVIRAADVSRSSAYRRWPYKDLFVGDLLRELARAAGPGMVDDALTFDHIKNFLLQRLDWFETPESRARLAAELIREAAPLDFAWVYQSPAWRTYFALHVTFLSLADGALRDEIQATLTATEHRFIAAVAQAWQFMAGLLGYRLRPELNATFETLASLLMAGERGLVLMALAMPELAARRLQSRPVGATETSAWSLNALSLQSIATAFLEPDPDFVWTEARKAALPALLDLDALQGAGILAPPQTEGKEP